MTSQIMEGRSRENIGVARFKFYRFQTNTLGRFSCIKDIAIIFVMNIRMSLLINQSTDSPERRRHHFKGD